MKKSLLAGVLLLTLPAGAAVAGDGYYGGRGNYGNDGSYGGRGDNGYDNGYYDNNERDGGHYDSFYRSYLRYLRECRKHRRVHRDLKGVHSDAHDEGFYEREDHRDVHGALGATHDQWHRNHPAANNCPSYNEYRRSYYRSRNSDRSGYGYGGGNWNQR